MVTVFSVERENNDSAGGRQRTEEENDTYTMLLIVLSWFAHHRCFSSSPAVFLRNVADAPAHLPGSNYPPRGLEDG